MRTLAVLTLNVLMLPAPAAFADNCSGNNAFILPTKTVNGNAAIVCDSSTARLVDEFPCKNIEEGEVGNLGWGLIGTVTGTSCGNGVGVATGSQSLIPSSGNTPSGFALATVSGTHSAFIANPATNVFNVRFRLKLADLDEIVVKVGAGDATASGNVDHTAANQDFVGIVFKDEDSDTAGECGGTTGDSANWQFSVVKDGTSAGLQDSGIAASGNWFWVSISSTQTGVQVCAVDGNTEPTLTYSGAGVTPGFSGGACYHETNSANIPTNSVRPFVIVSSCDGSSVSGNSNRVDIDYFDATASRY